MIADFALNLAANLTQWLFEPALDDLRRKITDPQRKALQGVYGRAFAAIGRSIALQVIARDGEMGEADRQVITAVSGKFVCLPAVRVMLLDVALAQRTLDLERLETHMRTADPDGALALVGVDWRQALPIFQASLVLALDEAAGAPDSPLANLWNVGALRGVQADLSTVQGQLAELQDSTAAIMAAIQKLPAIRAGEDGDGPFLARRQHDRPPDEFPEPEADLLRSAVELLLPLFATVRERQAIQLIPVARCRLRYDH